MKRSPWPYAIIGAFVALAAFDGWIIAAAIRNPSYAIEARPYEAGLEFDKTVAAMRAAQRAGLRFDVELRGELGLMAITGLPAASSADVSVDILRYDDPAFDRHASARTATGNFMVNAGPLKPGLYLVRCWIHRAGELFYLERAVTAQG